MYSLVVVVGVFLLMPLFLEAYLGLELRCGRRCSSARGNARLTLSGTSPKAANANEIDSPPKLAKTKTKGSVERNGKAPASADSLKSNSAEEDGEDDELFRLGGLNLTTREAMAASLMMTNSKRNVHNMMNQDTSLSNSLALSKYERAAEDDGNIGNIGNMEGSALTGIVLPGISIGIGDVLPNADLMIDNLDNIDNASPAGTGAGGADMMAIDIDSSVDSNLAIDYLQKELKISDDVLMNILLKYVNI